MYTLIAISAELIFFAFIQMWNDVGMVRCFTSEDDENSSIEVEFHNVAVHRSMHINNYLRHSMAALSTQALALSCRASDNGPSKIVVIALQGLCVSCLLHNINDKTEVK